MPELPEVETVRRVLHKHLPGHQIRAVQIERPKMLRGQSKTTFIRSLINQKIVKVERRAKYLIIRLQTGSLLIHLGMSGQVFTSGGKKPAVAAGSVLPDKHTHLRMRLDKDFLLYGRDPRMFGRYQYLSPEAEKDFFFGMGPEPLGKHFTPEYLFGILKLRRSSLKALLLNQKVIAGLGNIYTDEALFQARLSPFLAGENLTRAQTLRLHTAIRTILKKAICARGTSISDYLDPRHKKGTFQQQLRVYGQEGNACPACRTLIRKTVLAKRGTHWCPRCQVS